MTAHLDLITCCKIARIPLPVAEYRFHSRKWRLDYAWPDYRLAVEVEGGAWINGRHTRGYGFLADMVKYNQLAILRWHLLRFTPSMINSGEAVDTLREWFRGGRDDKVPEVQR